MPRTKDPTAAPDPFFSLSLQEQVEAARPYAKRVLIGAIEGTVDCDLEGIVKSIVGADGASEDEYTSAIFAARAFGLAQGLLLRAEAFSTKVTR